MKKLMLLGGIRYLLPVIKAAHNQGYQVVTADYLPNNIAHQFSDEYANVNIVDKEAVLKVAQEKRIDGIMSFGVDPGVVSASYVQEQLGLPSMGPFSSIEILQNKDRFRSFLRQHSFNCPQSLGFNSIKEAINHLSCFTYPVMVKPVDSAGSKGVSRVEGEDSIVAALEAASRYSISGRIIVEEFIEKRGFSSDTDSMSIDGQLSFVSFNTQYFDKDAANPYTPSAYSWPSSFSKEEEDYLTKEIQRLINLLGLETAVYNVETCVGIDGTPYIMEFTPRGGGNRLCEMLHYATGVDMITAMVRAAVGDVFETIKQKPLNGYWAEIILHAKQDGNYDRISIHKGLPGKIIEEDVWVKPGDRVSCFHGANNAIGTLVMRFDDACAMEQVMRNQSDWFSVIVK